MNSSTVIESSAAAGWRLLQEHSNKELLTFITCGSVDDGKSTLIGRLLLETGAIYDDQIATLQRDSERHGTTGSQVDPALLLDGLEDERQQGITIDVAYRYFTTSKRKFIIADTPGHEQFTRNMATGASTAQLAVILVDASKGLQTQTKRHAFIVSLLGIKHVVLAVNKMDLVGYDRSVFETIRRDFQSFAANFSISETHFVPLSALQGDNVTKPSPNTPWNGDATLLRLLEQIDTSDDENQRDLRFPVQWVNRPNASFRGYSGSVASGSLSVGDQIVVLPSKKSSRVRSIVTRNGDLSEATSGQAITVTLDDEVDIARGDMIVHAGSQPLVRRDADAMLVWMSDQPLVTGKSYWIKHTTKRTAGEIQHVNYLIDVNTLKRSSSVSLKLNEIGRCRLTLRDSVICDDYRQNRQTGSFIVVDRITHETVAAGMFVAPEEEPGGSSHWDDQPPGLRLQRAVSRIGSEQRAQQYGHEPCTLLITGLSGAGKTTLALELEQRLFELGKKCIVLDGQTMRFGVSRDLGFTAEERSENLRRAAEIAKLLNDAGLICVAAFVAPHDDVRQRVRELIGADRFLHVHLSTPLDTCRERDTTGRYDAADKGEIISFPGVTWAYEAPTNPDLEISTHDLNPDQVAGAVLDLLRSRSKHHSA